MIHKICWVLLFVFNVSQAQQIEFIDAKRLTAELTIDPFKEKVSGNINIDISVVKSTDSLFIDARRMEFVNVKINNKSRSFKVHDKGLSVYHKFKEGKSYVITFEYSANPKKAMYFIGWGGNGRKQVWTQGQGKYTSNWLPSFDDMNEKLEFDLSISFDKNYEVIANGKLLAKKAVNDSITNWHYDMKEPMSSYLVALAIGKYDMKREYSKSQIPIELYYYPEDKGKFEPTYRYTKRMFDYLEEEIGIAYPWQNYKQIPVKDFLYAGMENTSTTIFSDAFVVDSIAFKDKNYVNVNAHELAHQWFGDLVTETHGTHHWLQEGFATYYALLAEKEVLGEDYYYHKLFETSKQLFEAQKTDTIPLMNAKASSLTFYQKGAWALHILREKVGDKAFRNSVKQYLKKYQFKNVETDDFITIVAKESGQDLSAFVNKWLMSNKLPKKDINKSLIKSNLFKQVDFDIDLYYAKNELQLKFLEEKKMKLLSSTSIHYFFKQRAIQEYKFKDSLEFFKEAFRLGDVKVRQELADKFQKIPKSLVGEYESLLDDESYITIEKALFNLWLNFPERRKKYIEDTKNIIGFNDKNIRTLWLALALNTKGFEKSDYQSFYSELIGYTSEDYHFEVRRNTFMYLNELRGFNDTSMNNLEKGATHHNWRFRSFCKKMLTELKEANNNN